MGICTKCGVVTEQTQVHVCLAGNLPKDKQDIIDQLNLLDLQIIRPLTEDEPERVKLLIEQKIKLREQLK